MLKNRYAVGERVFGVHFYYNSDIVPEGTERLYRNPITELIRNFSNRIENRAFILEFYVVSAHEVRSSIANSSLENEERHGYKLHVRNPQDKENPFVFHNQFPLYQEQDVIYRDEDWDNLFVPDSTDANQFEYIDVRVILRQLEDAIRGPVYSEIMKAVMSEIRNEIKRELSNEFGLRPVYIHSYGGEDLDPFREVLLKPEILDLSDLVNQIK